VIVSRAFPSGEGGGLWPLGRRLRSARSIPSLESHPNFRFWRRTDFDRVLFDRHFLTQGGLARANDAQNRTALVGLFPIVFAEQERRRFAPVEELRGGFSVGLVRRSKSRA